MTMSVTAATSVVIDRLVHVGGDSGTRRRLTQVETQLLQCDDLASLCGEFERELLWGGAEMLHAFETVIAALFFEGDADCLRAVDKLRRQLAEPDATALLWESVFGGANAAGGAHLIALHRAMMLFFEHSHRLVERSSSANSVINTTVKSSFERWLRRALVLSAPVICVLRHSHVPMRYDSTFEWMIEFIDSQQERAMFRALLVGSGAPTD